MFNIFFLFSFQISRCSSAKVRDVAKSVFCKTNQLIVEALRAQGAKADGLTSKIFECKVSNPELGFVGEIQSVNEDLVNDILELDAIPVIAPIGYEDDEMLNINADIATVELVKAIKPYKAIFLSETGGIFDESDQLITTINLALEYQDLMEQSWLHSGMKLKLEQIKNLLGFQGSFISDLFFSLTAIMKGKLNLEKYSLLSSSKSLISESVQLPRPADFCSVVEKSVSSLF